MEKQLSPRQRAAAAAIAASRPAPPRPEPARTNPRVAIPNLFGVRALFAASFLALFAFVVGGGALTLPFAAPGAPAPPASAPQSASAALSALAARLVAGRVDAQSGAEAAAAASLCLLFAAGALPLCLGSGDALAIGGLALSALSAASLEALAVIKQ